ncbi:ATP-dependent helicase, partial [Paenibacillus sp. IB182496]|nr:ATP-dependent helicase [Paenibacillus sabuli]
RAAQPGRAAHPGELRSGSASASRQSGGTRRPGAKGGADDRAPAKSRPSKAERERDRKNKGAPKWLKKKREEG